MMYLTFGIIMGIILGFALEKGRVFEPGMIVGQFQLRNFIVIKMFTSAIATTMVVVSLMYTFGIVELHIKPTLYLAVIAGGLIFGVGMAISGACPGTVLAQVGAGYKDAWAILIGAILGAMTYGYLEPTISTWSQGPGEITLMDVTGVSFIVLMVVVVAGIAVILYLLERWSPWKSELGKDYTGLQAVSDQQQPESGKKHVAQESTTLPGSH